MAWKGRDCRWLIGRILRRKPNKFDRLQVSGKSAVGKFGETACGGTAVGSIKQR
jgi:hypothetical protein